MATLKDVAQKAGVNISTASRALNGNSNISEVTKENIRRIAKELNYIPNANARILAGKSSHMIGIIVPETDSDYFSKMINTLEASLQVHDYYLLISNTQYQPDKEQKILETFLNYNIDGVFLSCTVDTARLSRYQVLLNNNNIPLIALDARQPGAVCSQINVDDTAGMVASIQHLLQKGHKSIGYLGDYIIKATLREKFFKDALAICGLHPDDHPIFTHPDTRFERAGYEGMKYFLSLPEHPTAYLAGYDDIAIGAMRAISEAGLRIPEDIAIIGNDNGRAADFLTRRLTTLAPPVEKMAQIGVELILDSIRNKDLSITHNIFLKPEFIIRETT